MRISRQKREHFIVNAKAYLENAASDAYIKEQILAIGYDEARLSEGHQMQQNALESRQKQLRLINQAKAAHTHMREVFSANYASFRDDVRLFRSAFFRNIVVKEKLGLYNTRKRTVPGFLEQARSLYTTLQKEPDILNELGKFNITDEAVRGKLAGLEEVEKAYQVSLDVDRASQDATDESGKNYQKLADWIRELQAACRIVLKDKPQLLEKVGILVRSAKPPKKKNDEEGGPDQEAEEDANPGSS